MKLINLKLKKYYDNIKIIELICKHTLYLIEKINK